MNLSKRILSLTESATLAMAAKARKLKEEGIEVINLSLGEPDFSTPKKIQKGAIKAIKKGKYFAYPPVSGYLDLRKAISTKFKKDNQLDYSPDQIVVSNGAKQSIANVFMSLLNEGDEVLIFSPYWVSYPAMVQLAGGVPKFINGDIKNDFKVSAEQLKEHLTPKTKALIFSSPCNPTGSVFSKKELESIAAVLQDYPDIVVISDEIYEMINFIGKHHSIGSFPGMIERTVTVNGFSKGYAMTGWRVGYLGAPLEIAKACNKMQGQYTSANSSISQRAALFALTSSKKASHKMAKTYYKRREMVYKLLQGIKGWEINKPEGAFYFFPNVKDYFGKKNNNITIKNASDLCLFLLDDARVSLVTGEAFGAPDCIRLSYAASDKQLKQAIEKIKISLQKLA